MLKTWMEEEGCLFVLIGMVSSLNYKKTSPAMSALDDADVIYCPTYSHRQVHSMLEELFVESDSVYHSEEIRP